MKNRTSSEKKSTSECSVDSVNPNAFLNVSKVTDVTKTQQISNERDNEESKEDIIDIYDLIPPPDPLPNIKYTPEDSEAHRIVLPTIQNFIKKLPKESTKNKIEESNEQNYEIHNEIIEKKISDDELKSKKIISDIFAKKDINALYSLEFKELYRFYYNNSKGVSNPIVYSRNGKISYSGSTKSNKCYTFTMKDLQKVLNDLFQQKVKKPIYKLPFMNPKERIYNYYTPLGFVDETLIFESRFESGNLDLAIKLSDTEYNLVLQNDSVTNGNTQWFYFKVSNTRKNKMVTFHILNFVIQTVIN